MQTLIVSLVVAVAFAYAAWILMPSALRRRLSGALASVATGSLKARLERVQSGMEEPGCSTCKACATPAKAAAAGIKVVELRRR